jgi:hypothetical protein
VGFYVVGMCERGGWGRERCGLRNSTVIHIKIHQSHGVRHTVPGWVARSDAPVYMSERGGWGPVYMRERGGWDHI